MSASYRYVYAIILMSLLMIIQCQVDSSNPSAFQNEKTKYTVDIPASIDADMYKITVLDSADTLVYFENAKSKSVLVAVSSEISSVIIIEALKDNVSVYTGAANVKAGQTTGIQLAKPT